MRAIASVCLAASLVVVSAGGANARSLDDPPEIRWWEGDRSTLTINGQPLVIMTYLGVMNEPDGVCAAHFLSFADKVSAVAYRGSQIDGRARLQKVGTEGSDKASDVLELYSGATLLFTRAPARPGEKAPLVSPMDPLAEDEVPRGSLARLISACSVRAARAEGT